ncbi:MAG: protein kinase [Deltaproteobacteria bacterium]|nr:protein kinase [Deltaproteobacteria bacterium]
MTDTSMPSRLGRFKVQRRLGLGAMGEVFGAEDPDLNRPVAIKLLSAELTASPEYRERFRREAVAMASVAHPHVLQVFELGEAEGRPFFVMELLDGSDVQRLLDQEGPPPVQRAARWLLDAALGLGAAAERGLVHRDVKPANLMLHRGRVKVADFGIARTLQAHAALTSFGSVMGTPDYMAPEQALGLAVDARADIYALGITAWQLLVGKVPFEGPTYVDVLQHQVKTPLPDPRSLRPDVPKGLADLILKMAAKRAEDRPQRYDEVASALQAFAGEGAEAPASGPPAALRFVGGALGGKRVLLPLGESFVGRQVDCLVVLDDPQVSRRHAALTRGEAGLKVRDLASRNGVMVNGTRVPESELNVGDRLRIGDTQFLVEAAGVGEAPPVPEVTDPHMVLPMAALAPMGRAALLRDLARDLVLGAPLKLEKLNELTQMSLFPLRRFALVRLSEGKVQTLFHASRAETDMVTPLQAAMQLCMTSGTPVSAADARRDPRFASAQPQVATVLAAPLMGPQGAFGVLYGDAREVQKVAPEEAVAFETLAHLLAMHVSKG